MSLETHTKLIKILIVIIFINSSIMLITNLLINRQNKLENKIKQIEGVKI